MDKKERSEVLTGDPGGQYILTGLDLEKELESTTYLPPLKRQIQDSKLRRELRRRSIGQHTIEKALHAHVRVNTCRKILAAIDEYKRENCKSG